MNRRIYLLILFGALHAIVNMASAQSTAQTDSITDAGIMRPIDNFREDIQWNVASPDLYTFWIDNGLYGFYGPQPEILVDGIPVDANFFGWQNLNMLPIIKSYTHKYDTNPQIYNHNLSPAGYLNYKSDTVKKGLTASGSYYLANETGDPGPYVYDSLKTTPNIDRWGPDGEFLLSYKNNGWYAKGQFVFRNHLQTDLASNARLHFTASLLGTNTQYVNHRIYTNSKSGLLETGYNSESWGLRSRAVYGTGNDYIFLQPFGREIPAKTGYKQLAVDGYYKIGNLKFNARYTGHQKSIDKRIELHPYIFDWQQQKHTFALSSVFRSQRLRFNPNITYQRLKTQAPGLSNRYNDLILLSLNADFPLNSNSILKAEISIDYDEEQHANTYKISLPTELTSFWKINPQIISTQTLPLRQNSFSYWTNRGYTFADELDITFGNAANIEINELTSLKLNNTINLSKNISLMLEQQLVDHRNLNVPFQQVDAYEFVTDTEPGNFTVTQEEGTRLALFGKIGHSLSDLLKQSLSVNIQQTLSGTARYKSYFKQVPKTKVRYQLDVKPVDNLLLSLNSLYRSSTMWNEFSAIQGNQYRLPAGIPIREVTGTFDTQTPAYVDIGISMKKWFWDERLSAQLSLNNMLNNELRMHPLGADLNTKLDVKVNLKL